VESLAKEEYEQPLLTRHQPLLAITGQSKITQDINLQEKEAADVNKRNIEDKIVTDNSKGRADKIRTEKNNVDKGKDSGN
jgi:hypothetical protein